MVLLLDVAVVCPTSPVDLTQAEGTFGITGDQYKENTQCSWKIQVETAKVSTVT